MESWREVWRKGFAKVLPLAGLEALADAIRRDDPRLIQGATTTPPPVMCVEDWPCEQTCGLGWTRFGVTSSTVGEVSEHFSEMCRRADNLIGEPAACRWFLNWFDDTPRATMRAELLPEVELAIAERKAAGA
jgi:hypothetical protein